MASSRKDSRGYALRTGETQRKDGRYSFSYTNREGRRKVVYAKTLVDLRQREKQVARDIGDGIDPDLANRLTVNDIYDPNRSL